MKPSTKKSIKEYLPEQNQMQLVLVQAYVPESLVNEVKTIMKKLGHKWPIVITACLTKFRDEMKEEK